LATVTATFGEVRDIAGGVARDRLDRIDAVGRCRVSQASENGAVVTSGPSVVPLSLYRTPTYADIVGGVDREGDGAVHVGPRVGVVSVTTGAVSSGGTGPPTRSAEGTLTTKASSRWPPRLLDQMK
jgi:hypothetical protein